MQSASIDPARAADDDRGPGGSAQDERVELLAALFRVLLRVVQASQGAARGEREPIVVEEDRRGHQRPGEGSASRLVCAGHEAALA